MKPVVLDSTALLGFCDPDDPNHAVARAAVAECLAVGQPLVVPVSVLSEVLVGAFRSTPHAVRTVEGFVDDLVTEVRPIDRPTGRAAARYRADFPALRLAAALVIGTAKVIDAAQILTTDPTWAEVDPRIRVLRPPAGPSAR
jgi:predicted nucleic acid-binding protein